MKNFRFQKSKGVTLIEVLIAVLVLSIGLLGLGALQGVALQSGQLSYQRTQATNIAYRVADEYRGYRSQSQPPAALRNQWIAEMNQVLPNGTLTHSRDGDVVTVTVTWRDDRDDAVSANEPDQITFQTRI